MERHRFEQRLPPPSSVRPAPGAGRAGARWGSALLTLLLLATPAGISAEGLSEPLQLFVAFTAHIAKQIESDKREFAEAETCIHWFYQQLRPKPSVPKAQPTADERHECQNRYPQGLDDARDDLSRTQSTLSLSLTFYEFALVGDRNDDEAYSETELQDILEAFGFGNAVFPPDATLLATLNNKFDALRKFGGLESLMASMDRLYDKGYRFTVQDREALNRIMG